jgi:predicted Fe-Mo cluster-binding NifX family protein
MMKAAIPCWQGRISPVLDSAERFLFVESADGETVREEISLPAGSPFDRARSLAGRGVEAVVCGAVSREMELALRSAGLEVLANRCGPVDEVVAAFMRGQLDEERFAMPGCCGRRRRNRRGRPCDGRGRRWSR